MKGKALVAVVVALVVVELVARLFVASWDFQQTLKFDPSGQPPCFRLQPGVQTTYEGWVRQLPVTEVHINEHGLRGPAIARSRTPERFRIALVGDSHVFGLGVNFDGTLGTALAAQLPVAATALRAVEVLNFGVPGYDFAAMASRIEEDVSGWCPDMVFIFLCADDLDEPVCGQFGLVSSWLRTFALGRLWLTSRRPVRRAGKRPMSAQRVSTMLRQVRKNLGENTGIGLVKLCDLGGPTYDKAVLKTVSEIQGVVFDGRQKFTALSAALGDTAILYDGHLTKSGNNAFAQHLAARFAAAIVSYRDAAKQCEVRR